MRALMAYQWPGNVRQLENAVERAVALSAGRREVAVTDLPVEVQTTPEATEAPFVDFPDSWSRSARRISPRSSAI